MAASDYLKTQRLGFISGTNRASAPANLHFSLHSGDPSGTGANEVTATYVSGRASYASSGFGTITTVGSVRRMLNTALTNWGNSIAAGSIPWIGIWDASTGGNFLYGIRVVTSLGANTTLDFGNGDPVSLAIGSLTVDVSIVNQSIYLADIDLNWLKGTNAPSAPASVYTGFFTALSAANVGTEVTSTIRPAGRLAVSAWTSPVTDGVAKLMKNSATVAFGASAGTVSGVNILGLYDAAPSGNLLIFVSTTPFDVFTGQNADLPPNYIQLRAS